jgi:HSP20 family protein
MATETHTQQPTQRDEPRTEHTRSGRTFRPHVDIHEEGDELVLVADMPGVKAEDVDVRFEDGVLTIHGPVPPRWPEQGEFLLYEYGVGDFYRTFRVSEQIDASRIQAEYADGVLTLHLPKTESAKPRKIEVQVAR